MSAAEPPQPWDSAVPLSARDGYDLAMSAAEPPQAWGGHTGAGTNAMSWRARTALVAAYAGLACTACSQIPPSHEPAAVVTPPQTAAAGGAASEPPATGPIAPLAWLAGCWQGSVNEREFREQWLPLRGGMLIGAGQQVLHGEMQDYEFLRIEARPGGVYFTQFSGDRKEMSFKLAGTTTDDKDTIFTFANVAATFPARLVYRQGTEGWLYETIEGVLNGAEKKVIYPLRRVSCETGELIPK
jgi:hypothetical protein